MNDIHVIEKWYALPYIILGWGLNLRYLEKNLDHFILLVWVLDRKTISSKKKVNWQKFTTHLLLQLDTLLQ